MDEQRREPRFRYELAVTMTAGRRTWSLSTHDVSYRGMFVRLDDPPKPREFVRLEVSLPDGGKLVLQGMVAFVTREGDEMGRPPGVGIQFFGSGGAEHQAWEAFVRKVWEEQQRRKPKTRAPHAHVSVVVRLRAADARELESVIAEALSQGGLPIATEHALAPGSTMALEVVHPHTGEIFDLPCVVRSRAGGVGIELSQTGAEVRKLLTDFVSSGSRAPRKR